MKRNLLDLQNECRTKKKRVPANVVEAMEHSQELVYSSDVPVNVVLSSKVPADPGGDAAELLTELKKGKALIAELKSVETMTVRPHEKFMGEVKKRHAEKSAFEKRPLGRA